MSRRNQIDKAIAYIELHLRENLALEDIAEVANYSPWHFHRLFYASTGVTVGEYIRKRRLSEASRELVHTSKPIVQIAKSYQFDSQAAFTRSFKTYCGCTPGKLRAKIRSLTCFEPMIKTTSRGKYMQSPKIITKDTFRVLGVLCRSTMNDNTIPALWDKFHQICGDIPGVIQPGAALGICYADEDVEMTPDTPFNYLAGMEVSMDTPVPAGMVDKVVPAAEYAVFEHIGSLDTLHDTYSSIYGEWLPASNYERFGDIDFELYDERFRYGEAESVMEIWVPVKKV